MIEKQRLEELIKQGATIHFIYNGNVDLKEGKYKDDFILNESYVSIYWSTRSHQVKYENLFETKEEAEWHKEFGCIERTERLELESWDYVSKRFNNEPKKFKETERSFWVGEYSYYLTVNPEFIILEKYKFGEFESKLIKYATTKENYTKVCRKVKELFLGENNNDE